MCHRHPQCNGVVVDDVIKQVVMSCIHIFEDELTARLGPRTAGKLPNLEMLAWVYVDFLHRCKTGSSAGLPIFLEVVAMLWDCEIRTFVSTGEVTMGGSIVPVGGINDKIRALRSYKTSECFMVDGKRVLMLPQENATWYWDVDEEDLRKKVVTEHCDDVTLIPVVDVLQAVDLALVPEGRAEDDGGE